MSDIQEYQDTDDIFRDIDIDNDDDVNEEIHRLTRKRIGFRASFTSIVNSINNLIIASRGDNGTVNKSQANKEALLRAREKLEVRYEKLQTLYNRQMVLTRDRKQEENDDFHHRAAGAFQGFITQTDERYNQVIRDLSRLDLEIQPQPNWNDGNHNEQHNHLKPIMASEHHLHQLLIVSII